jgi:glycosyltransferase involved in cell wall biosynthesis
VPYDLAIVVPVYNEAANVLPLASQVAAALAAGQRAFLLVFVDDASTDGTWDKIQEAHRREAHVMGLRHARNRGQSAALWTGFQATASPVLATLDGDLQNDPADLPRLLAELDHADFVCGVRQKRRDSFVRRASSGVARWARRVVLGVDFADSGCSLRVFKRHVLTGVPPFHGFHRFLPILVQGGGAVVREVPVNHRPRVAGVSKYGIWNRLGRGLVDLLAMAWYQRRRMPPGPVERLPAREQQGT